VPVTEIADDLEILIGDQIGFTVFTFTEALLLPPAFEDFDRQDMMIFSYGLGICRIFRCEIAVVFFL